MLDEFRRIAETAMPQAIQSRVVTPDEARAVITSFNRLTDPLRHNFMALPVDNIIEFSMMQTKKRPSLYNYMDGVQESVEPETLSDAPQPIPETERDHVDQSDAPPPVVQTRVEKPKPRKRRIEERQAAPRAAEKFFTQLTERLEQVATPPSIVVEPPVLPFDKLVEAEQAMLTTLTGLTERVEQLAVNADQSRSGIVEVLAAQRDMINKITESQRQISATQSKLIESQAQIAGTISLLAQKVMEFCQTPPVVNIPAPVVNVTMQDGRRTKVVERDANNLITRIVEGFEES